MAARRRVKVTLSALVLMGMVSACSQPLTTREKGTLVGGGLGAASGAIIGAAVGAPGAGAAIGGAMGALGGGLIGDQFQGLEHRAAWQQQQINRHSRELRRQRREIANLKKKTESQDNEYY
jgi:osmotically inducible lipoprotein OsmB